MSPFRRASWTSLIRILRPLSQDVIVISDDDSPPPPSRRPSFAPLPKSSISSRTLGKAKDGEKEGLTAVEKQVAGSVDGGRDERDRKDGTGKETLRDAITVSSKQFLALRKRLTPFSEQANARPESRGSESQFESCHHSCVHSICLGVPDISCHHGGSCINCSVLPSGMHQCDCVVLID